MAQQISGTVGDVEDTERDTEVKDEDDEETPRSEITPSRQSTKYTSLMLKLKVSLNCHKCPLSI